MSGIENEKLILNSPHNHHDYQQMLRLILLSCRFNRFQWAFLFLFCFILSLYHLEFQVQKQLFEK